MGKMMEETIEETPEKELTPQEREYLNYWIQSRHKRPTKRLLVVTWSLFGLLFCIFLPVLANQNYGGESAELWLLFLLILVILFGLLLYFAIGLRERMKRLEAADYEVYRRTKITKKEMHRVHANRSLLTMQIPCYLCNGIDGEIAPVSKEFFDAAKPGDDVTVIRIEEMAVLLGITFPEEVKYAGKE